MPTSMASPPARAPFCASLLQLETGQHLPLDALEIDEERPVAESLHGPRVLDARGAQAELPDVLSADVLGDSERAGAVHAPRARVRAVQTPEREPRRFVTSPRSSGQVPALRSTPFLERALRGFVPAPGHQARVPSVAGGEVGEYLEQNVGPRAAQVHAQRGGQWRNSGKNEAWCANFSIQTSLHQFRPSLRPPRDSRREVKQELRQNAL